jgi:hypothetical protein
MEQTYYYDKDSPQSPGLKHGVLHLVSYLLTTAEKMRLVVMRCDDGA